MAPVGAETGLHFIQPTPGFRTALSFSANFPTICDAFDGSLGGGADALFTKTRPAGTGAGDLIYSTYLGGNNTEFGTGLSILESHVVYLTGFTLSSQASFPVSNGAANTTYSGDQDAYVVQLNLLYAAPPVATTDWTPAPNQAHVPVITNKYPCNFP